VDKSIKAALGLALVALSACVWTVLQEHALTQVSLDQKPLVPGSQGLAATAPLSFAPETLLLKALRATAAQVDTDCSGPAVKAEVCAKWWDTDVTVYNMLPPTGVLRGQAALQKSIETDSTRNTQTTEMTVWDAGHVGGGTGLVWTVGSWARHDVHTKVLRSKGRFSSIMKDVNGTWKFFVMATMEIGDASLVPVQNGLGGSLLSLVNGILGHFNEGYFKNDFSFAFQDYAADAKFPCMFRFGSTSLQAAIADLKKQKAIMSPGFLHVAADEVLTLSENVIVAHGIAKMVDADTELWTFGRFTFLMVLERADPGSKFQVTLDFSPNAWLELG